MFEKKSVKNRNIYRNIAVSFKEIISSLWGYRELIFQFSKREVIGRYRGSYLGILWSFITPILMLAIYTFVFSMVFKARWGVDTDSKAEFALILFCGLIAYNLFAEIIGRAPNIITNNSNYVKKIVFPLEILPLTIMGSAFVHFVISLIILIIALIIFMNVLHWTIIFVPIVLMPIIFLSLGLAWFLASLGVFLRDIGHVVGIAITALMFLSPIFYPISAVPNELHVIYNINPISHVVEDMRRVIIWGQYPDWQWLLFWTMIGLVVSILGYIWFQKTRKGFADVI
jgi:lipopolysaccharide transport system permease protein